MRACCMLPCDELASRCEQVSVPRSTFSPTMPHGRGEGAAQPGMRGCLCPTDVRRPAREPVFPSTPTTSPALRTPSWRMLAEPTRLGNPRPSHAPREYSTITLADSLILGVEVRRASFCHFVTLFEWRSVSLKIPSCSRNRAQLTRESFRVFSVSSVRGGWFRSPGCPDTCSHRRPFAARLIPARDCHPRRHLGVSLPPSASPLTTDLRGTPQRNEPRPRRLVPVLGFSQPPHRVTSVVKNRVCERQKPLPVTPRSSVI